MSELEFNCYLTGLIDGEGGFHVCKRTRENTENYEPTLTITNQNMNVLKAIKQRLGFGYICKSKSGSSGRDCYRYVIQYSKTKILLKRVIHHLQIKREQAILLYVFPYQHNGGSIRFPTKSQKLNNYVQETQGKIYLMMRELNACRS
jgi:hypothetical protein